MVRHNDDALQREVALQRTRFERAVSYEEVSAARAVELRVRSFR